jgi:hypothetical protein
MQQWEYLTLTRKRDKGVFNISAWKDDVVPRLPQLGIDGWELVAVSPHAGTVGMSGMTSEELWVFKRPKV